MLGELIRAARVWWRLLERGVDGIRRLFLSKSGVNKRIAARVATMKKRELEAERLDRLRNPRDYQGR